jgi:hypothetical protein
VYIPPVRKTLSQKSRSVYADDNETCLLGKKGRGKKERESEGERREERREGEEEGRRRGWVLILL